MKNLLNRISSVILCFLVCSTANVYSGELGHYQAGMPGLRDFFLPDPGLYGVMYSFNYKADELKNRNGDDVGPLTVTGPLGTTTLSVDPDIDLYGIAPTFIWVSPWQIFGAKYAALIAPSFVDASINASLNLARNGRFFSGTFDRSLSADTGWGIGDLFVQPLLLGWGGKHYDISAGYGFYAPTGDDGLSLEFWTHQLQAAGAFYPFDNKGTAITLAGVYEIHSERNDADITPGERFTLNYGISQFLPLNKEQTLLAEIGLTGYSQWQVNEDSGSDVPKLLNVSLNAKDEIHAAGIQAGLTYVPMKISLTFRYLWEYDAEGRFEGEWLGLTLAKGF